MTSVAAVATVAAMAVVLTMVLAMVLAVVPTASMSPAAVALAVVAVITVLPVAVVVVALWALISRLRLAVGGHGQLLHLLQQRRGPLLVVVLLLKIVLRRLLGWRHSRQVLRRLLRHGDPLLLLQFMSPQLLQQVLPQAHHWVLWTEWRLLLLLWTTRRRWRQRLLQIELLRLEQAWMQRWRALRCSTWSC